MADRPAGSEQHALEQIFWQFPDRQNRTSSSWWFFLLFPEGNEGYGPDQLMFAVASRTGRSITLNGQQYTGMDSDRPVGEEDDRFNAVSFGWYTDGDTMHDDIIHQPATAQLSRGSHLDAMTDTPEGVRGTEILASDRPGMDVHIVGDSCEARFEAWGENESLFTTPQEATDVEIGPAGAHLVNWPRMRFQGSFTLPDGQQDLTGICYFQRVCLNVPLFPWKWMCAFFPDGSTFLAFIPYLGPQLLRRGDSLFSSTGREQTSVALGQEARWEWGGSGRQVELDTVSIQPVITDSHPRFRVRACNDSGDAISFTASPYHRVTNQLDRQLLPGLASHYTHNEYPVRINRLEGSIDGRQLDDELGQGFGNLEYTWGLGL